MINIFRPIFSKNWEITSIRLHTANLKTKENPPSYTYSWNLTLVWGASQIYHFKASKELRRLFKFLYLIREQKKYFFNIGIIFVLIYLLYIFLIFYCLLVNLRCLF